MLINAKTFSMQNTNIHQSKIQYMSPKDIGAVKELYKNVIVIWYKLKTFQIVDIKSNTCLWIHTHASFNKNPFKYDYYGYQNAIPIGNNQILFVENNKDSKSSISQIFKDSAFNETEDSKEKEDKNDSYQSISINVSTSSHTKDIRSMVKHGLNGIPRPKNQGKISKRIKVVSFLTLDQIGDVFPSESTIVLDNKLIVSGTKYGSLKIFEYW